MTEKQIIAQGLTQSGWKKIDDLLARANKEQRRIIMMKCADKLPQDIVTVELNKKVE